MCKKLSATTEKKYIKVNLCSRKKLIKIISSLHLFVFPFDKHVTTNFFFLMLFITYINDIKYLDFYPCLIFQKFFLKNLKWNSMKFYL